jgi:putative tryptophan/tyrosine transport system substrate-binding protein
MKKVTKLLLFIACIIAFCCFFIKGNVFANSARGNKLTKIGVIQIVNHPALDKTLQGIVDELKAFKKDDLVIDIRNAQGSPTLASQIANKFSSESFDVIVAIGTTAAQSAAQATKTIPVVFSSVTDPIAAKLVLNLSNPGGNVTGVSNFIDIEPQLRFFKKQIPSLKRLGMIYNPGEINSVRVIEMTKLIAKEVGLEMITKPAIKTSDVSQATVGIIKDVDAIFISNDNTSLSAIKNIVNIAKQNNKLVLCSDIDTINSGVNIAMGPDQYELGKQTGRIVIDIINGQLPKNVKVGFPEKILEIVNK